MAYEIVMPQLSDSMNEGKLISWKVKPGDSVKVGDVIADVESDKAIMEVQSFKDGVVKELKLQEGQSVPVGTVIALIEAEEGSKPREGKEQKRDHAEEAFANEKAAKRRDSEETEKKIGAELKSEKEREVPSVVNELFGEAKVKSPASSIETHPSGMMTAASPKARALAARYGIDIEALQKDGKLPVPAHEEDVHRYYLSRYFTPKALELIERYHLKPELFDKRVKHVESEIMEYVKSYSIPLPKPLSPMRKAIISTVEAAAKKPTYRIYDYIDATNINKYEKGEITITVLLLKLFAAAVTEHEPVRTTLGPNGLQVWPNSSISLAMANGDALYMPVFKELERKTIQEIAEELAAMKEKVKRGKVASDELTGSTFGLSNLGMTGIERFDAMINANDSGIAAIGAQNGGRIAVTLTFDHRVVNGWQAAGFMQRLKELALDSAIFKKG